MSSDETSSIETEESSSSLADSNSAASVSTSSTTETSSSASADYATVGSGQGIYRVATNNGLTVAELLQLNPGLSSSSVLSPGQRVRIK
ncbi:LysM peptidoglycan-binding domain-containing protein [Liquorilactobacillus vini]|nr:LysM peptidoglycan-binding domain-containing protein [Liquorilactobacillus vini]